jgi:hypothetical protein
MDTLFSASGELYEMTDEGVLRGDEGVNFGTMHQVQSTGSLGPAKADDYRAGYSSPEVVRPRHSISNRDSPSGTNNRGAQLSQHSVQQSPQGARDVRKLARSLSNSALSPRLRDGALNQVSPVDISQARPNGVRRPSNATISSDASYSGSRHSDIQWDAAGRIAHTGHRVQSAPLVRAALDNGSDRQSLTAVSSESDLQGVAVAVSVGERANGVTDAYSTRSDNGENSAPNGGKQNGALIRGNNNRDVAELWNISSSDDDDDVGHGETPRSNNGAFRTTGKARADKHRAPGASAASTTSSSGHYAAPLDRHHSRRKPAPAHTPWSPHPGNFVNSLRSEPSAAVHTLRPRNTQEPNRTFAVADGVDVVTPGRKVTSSKVLTPTKRAVSVPKVRVPVASLSAITPEGQMQALAARVAVRSEADDYIASLKKGIK